MQLKLLSLFRTKNIPVSGTNLILRPPAQGDFEQWQSLRFESQDFLRRWEPKWPSDDLTKIGYRRRLKAYSQHRNSDRGRTYFLFDVGKEALLGGLSLTRINYGVSKSATLGYWMGARHAGLGHMKKAVPALLTFAFKDLGLNRVEAACLPSNERSIRLLNASGFRQEGYAREYLEINGRAEDHILFAKLKSEHTVRV